MRKLLSITLLAAFSALLGTSCGVVGPTPSEPVLDATVTESELSDGSNEALSSLLANSVPGCTYKCIKCLPPNAPACEYLCVYIGKCDSRCTTVEVCSEGFSWSDRACRCLPEQSAAGD